MTPTDLQRAVRLRFAPSPTGYLHIGGVRTALFNWLFARRHGGTFIIRIDDTDRERNVEEALAPILDGFRWLGIQWDEGPEVGGSFGPYYQSQRGERYRAAVERLLERGYAYYDYATPEEIQAEREEAEREKRRFVYSRRFMAESAADRERFEGQGRKAFVRLKMPREGSCRFHDAIRGEVETVWASEQDHVIQRADGSCLYHLASVVDDVEMEISHVVRAEEHLSNTPRQIFIFEGLEAAPPVFAHLPYVAEPGSKVKLSKRKLAKYLKNADFAELYRHGQSIVERLGETVADDAFNPVIVDFYRRVGFLPEAIVNYLLLLGWSLDDHTEYLSREEMIANFSLERVNKAPASFDPKKLMAFEEHFMAALPAEDKLPLALPFAERRGWTGAPASEDEREFLLRLIRAAGDRIKVAGDILDYDDFFTPEEELTYDEKAFEKRLVKPPAAAELLAAMRTELANTESFAAGALEELFHRFIEKRGIKLGEIIHAVRVAVTGKAVGFGMFDILALLGRDRVLARIDRALALLAPK